MTKLILIVALLLLTGCTPFVGYSHLSMPNVADDGYDLLCGGFEYERGWLVADVAVCENMNVNHTDTFAKIDFKARWPR
jgi:hypothetical protein